MFSCFNINMRITVVTLLALALVASTSMAASKKYAEIDADGLKNMMATEDVLVVFPLSQIEYKDLHITGSVNIPLNQLAEQLPADKSQKIVFYCLGIKCTASWRAADKAVKLGYENVYAFREGLPAWKKAGYPTTTIEKLPQFKAKKMTTEELSQRLAGDDDIVLLDICLQQDAEKFWIETSKRVHIPLNEMEQRYAEIPKDKEIAVICLKGKRSPTVIRYLSGKGYKNLYQVEGGMQKWIMDGKPVTTRKS